MIDSKHFFSSWSGGKDSCLAHYRALNSGGIAKSLLTMLENDGECTISHLLPLDVLVYQAKSLGLPLITRNTGWNTYEEQFLQALEEVKETGITHGVFGDIDIDDHLRWVEKNCSKAAITSYLPLWKESRKDLIHEFIDAGFEAWVVVVNNDKLPPTLLGKKFTKELIEEIESYGVDACGEEGEFHTVVVDGPIFAQRIPLRRDNLFQKDNYTFQLVSLETPSLT